MLSATFGESLYDYPHLNISAYQLDYNSSQRIFIGGECDFSFTASLIKHINSGSNCCSTSLYTKPKWDNMINTIRIRSEIQKFTRNLAFCRKNQCKVFFGVDGINITATQKQWELRNSPKNANGKFDRIIYTFVRQSYHADGTVQYNHKNEALYFKLLRAAKTILNTNGQIHLMMFAHQFWGFNLKYSVSKLNLQICALADLSKNNCLTKIFQSYQPRDSNGYYMQLNKYSKPYKMYKIYMCCLKIKNRIHIENKSLVLGTFCYPMSNHNKYLSIVGLRKKCTLRQLYNLFKPYGIISELQICSGVGMIRFQQQFEAQVVNFIYIYIYIYI